MRSEIEKAADTFDEYGRSYSQTVNQALGFSGLSVDFFTRVKADYLLDLVSAHFRGRADLAALDVGCGVGNFHRLLLGHFKRLAGVDISEESIALATQSNPGVGYAAYDGLRLPYDDGSFDVAFTICVMHHVPPEHWPNFVSEMHRVVKPGGLALVFEHNPRNPMTMRVVNRCPFDADAVLLRSEKTRGLFEEAGFDDVHARFILAVPAAGTLLRRVDRLFDRLPLGAQYYVAATRR